MALDFQALVAGEKVSTTVTIKLEHTDMVQGIVEQEMEEVHYKADPANLLDTIVIDFDGKLKYRQDYAEILERERQRQNAIGNLGFRFVRIGWDDLMRPERLRSILEAARVPRCR